MQTGGSKVLDIALRYGYESPEAFTRAFGMLHGLSPVEARKPGAKLLVCPRMNFQFELHGGSAMNYRLEKLPPFTAIGMGERVRMNTAYQEVPQLWQKAAEEGAFAQFFELGDPHGKPRGILGICSGGSWGQGEQFDYILGTVSLAPAPEGWRTILFPECQWAVFEAEGMPETLQEVWTRFYREWVPAAGYELAPLPAIEAYLHPEENRNELWIPVLSRGQEE
ncbi:AraC family transcriptional regulator [Paenibacillus pasadenensis]|uniref:AraC family transcriptional regulator n=1 Tax=Paenibacillus pasadenensis TaxID=217090 RepID=UPI00203AA065|nr:AraC family transcriptional regulator [Paenibacillus pasadenensis]MCM3749210.1 AraC family transcriptional regulator [Paenibacillus pasadenensis]